MSAILPTGYSHADSTATCTGPTQIFAALPDGSTRLYTHPDPVNGSAGFSNPTVVGGPNGGTLMGGPSGDVYNIQHNGEFRRYHWNGSGWDNPYQVIAQGWGGWDLPAYHNRITVDPLGNIYSVGEDNNLHVNHYDTAAGKLVEHVIDTNWGNYNLIIAGGPGVLYARDPNVNGGELYRYQYDANSQRWLQRKRDLGIGWNIYSGIFSAGGDVLYGHTNDPRGELYWYHFNNDTGLWAGRNYIGFGWDPSWLVTSISNTCSSTLTLPPKPSVLITGGIAATLVPNTGGRLEYYYVGKDGSVVTVDQSNVADGSTAQFGVLATTGTFTGRVAAALNDNGGAQVLALGTDSEIRGAVQPAIAGNWSTLSPAGGYFPVEPAIVRKPDNTLVAFGLDAQGGLWYRPQLAKNGDLTSWLNLGSTGMKDTLTAVVQGSTIRLFALDSNNRLSTATVTGTALSSWTELAGLASGVSGSAVPSVVIRTDGTAQIFALNDSDMSVRTIKQNTDLSWPTTWTTIPGLTAAGAPSALATNTGTVEVVVKGSDGLIYNTGQLAPANPAFRSWSVVDPMNKAGSDPSAAQLSTGVWAIVFRDTEDRVYVYHTVPSGSFAARAAGDSPAPTFVGGLLPVQRH